jgi:TolB protein
MRRRLLRGTLARKGASVRRLLLPMIAAVTVTVVAGASASHGPSRVSTGNALPAGEIVFARGVNESDSHPSLYTMRPDGSHVRLLTRDADGPAVSPDGSRIAFCRNRANWVMRRDGSAQRQLTPQASKEDAGYCDQAWSADSRAIYVTRYWPKRYTSDIYTVSAEGGQLRRVTDSKACPADPAPSLDGRLIAYDDTGFECGRGLPSIRAVTTAGRPADLPFRVLDDPNGWYPQYDPVWAPDGRHLAWVVDDMGPSSAKHNKDGIWVASANGSPPQRVVEGSTPAWSPDAKWITFERYVGEPKGYSDDIWLVRSDRTQSRALTHTKADDRHPAWLPPSR